MAAISNRNEQVIEELVAQHAGEASFLWLLRNRAVRAPHYSLTDLAHLDSRVEAHLDGLRVAGDFGWKICQETLSQGIGNTFAGAALAFSGADSQRVREVLQIAAGLPKLAAGVVAGLAWLPYPMVENHIRSLLQANEPAHRQIGIAASAAHRRTPRSVLVQALADPDLDLRSRALRATGELGAVDLLSAARKSLNAAETPCRFWAAWSAAILLPDKEALTVLNAFVETRSSFRERALDVAMRRMELGAAINWQIKLASNPRLLRLAIIGGGIIGDPEGIPWLVRQMKLPLHARVAGEAFSMITGVDLPQEDLEGRKPEDLELGPTNDPEDDQVDIDPDEDLPWPNVQAVEKWWAAHQGQFAKGTRYLLGKPISIEWLHQVLRTGRQRQRAAAALELTIRQRGTHLFEVRAPALRQLQLLGVEEPS
jgi:uncharacterized protein (TIGR02270 family)